MSFTPTAINNGDAGSVVRQAINDNFTNLAAYVDGLFEVLDIVQKKGVIDCSSNPNYPAASNGHLYRVSVSGKIGGASGEDVTAGDVLLCNVDDSASGDQATVGANWSIIKLNIDVADLLYKDDVQTVTNKDLTSATNVLTYVTTVASSATPTPTGDRRQNKLLVTALADDATFGAPSGTPADGNMLLIRVKDDDTPRNLAYNAIYRAVGITLPTVTVAGKTIYLVGMYNDADSVRDMLGYKILA